MGGGEGSERAAFEDAKNSGINELAAKTSEVAATHTKLTVTKAELAAREAELKMDRSTYVHPSDA